LQIVAGSYTGGRRAARDISVERRSGSGGSQKRSGKSKEDQRGRGLCHAFGFNSSEVILEKLALNEKKYPIEKAKGSAKKYTES
jgi:hypothetical protein